MRWIKLFLKYTAIVLIVALAGLALVNWFVAEQRDVKLNEDQLSLEQKTLLQGVVCVKHRRGNDIWPGFGDAPIPLVTYNDTLEFLVDPHGLQQHWTEVNDTFFGEPYYKRPLESAEAFAIPVDSGWAGSLGTRAHLNREMLLGLRSELPPVIAQLFPYFMATIPKDQYVTAMVHEVFHAFEATRASARFHQAEDIYRHEGAYPFGDDAFARAWNREGTMLFKAYHADNTDSLRRYARRFIELREQRRNDEALTDSLMQFEQLLEWLEGLAKYAEMRSYELAALCPKGTYAFEFNEGLPYWQNEIKRLKKLGNQDGDFRFYLSGMAQAFILDRLNPDWKTEAAMRYKPLEQILRETLDQKIATQ